MNINTNHLPIDVTTPSSRDTLAGYYFTRITGMSIEKHVSRWQIISRYPKTIPSNAGVAPQTTCAEPNFMVFRS